MTDVLHTDDPNREGNMSAEEYERWFQELKERAGDDGLHKLPEETDRG